MLPPVNCVCQPGGIAVPGDLFSGAPSPELARTSGTQLTGQGKTIWTGLPDYLTCLLRNLYAGQEATVRTGHGRRDWFQIGKGG